MKARPHRGWSLHVLAVASLLLAGHASAVSFGHRDVRTVFHIAKSDDDNRVDYGVRLDESCQPVGESPMYAYWHRFEPGEPVFGDLNVMDQRVYGITQQRVRTRTEHGSWISMRVAALPSLRILILTQRHGAGCVARAQIPLRERPAFVDRVFVQLGGGFLGGVEHVEFSGVDTQTQRRVTERRQP